MPSEVDSFPIIPHEATGAECCGCVVVKVTGNDAELVCNECGAVIGVMHRVILRDLVSLIPDRNPAPLADLLRSHHELRGALLMAGKHIRKLNFGRREDPVLAMLRKVLREAREVARRYRGVRS